jgi:lysophospholipase L1-like esterase
MMAMKILRTLAVLVLSCLVFSTTGFAKGPNAKESLVALGDSITFGYNLGVNNEHPSKFAFPYLIDKEGKDFRVDNLGVPGWRTDQLLNALEHDQKFQQAVKHADTIILDIGSNDLLQGLKAGEQDPSAINRAISTMLLNLTKNISQIRTLTDAPIVVYNIYNPFQPSDPLHSLGDLLLPSINGQIGKIVDSYKAVGAKIVLADAYNAYGNNQPTYILPGDIHPTIEGQEVLANLAEEALGL